MLYIISRRAVFAMLAILVLLATLSNSVVQAAPATHNWTQELNNFDDYPTDNLCGQDQTTPCLYWQEPHNQSGTEYVYLYSSLSLGSYDFHSEVNNAISYYNAANALNPYFSVCVNGARCASVDYRASDSSDMFPCTTYAGTALYWGTATYAPNYNGGIWWAYLTATDTAFNTTIKWNNNFNWTVNGCNINADGRKVATHETGHAEGLGHTNFTAIMHQGPENFYTPQPNDVQGLQAIYPGNFP